MLIVRKYTHILMCRDRVDGSLRGTMLFGIEHKGDYTLIRLGLTSFKTQYRGSPYIKLILAYVVISEFFKHPLTPLYFISTVCSHRAYLVGTTMREFYPVYNRETPEHIKKIFAEFAAVVVGSGCRAKYNPETFVIEQEDSRLAENLTALSKQDLQNPHIKFFVEQNPGWKKVSFHREESIHTIITHMPHTITCLYKHPGALYCETGVCITWVNLLLSVKSITKKALGKTNCSNPTKVQYYLEDGEPWTLGGRRTLKSCVLYFLR